MRLGPPRGHAVGKQRERAIGGKIDGDRLATTASDTLLVTDDAPSSKRVGGDLKRVERASPEPLEVGAKSRDAGRVEFVDAARLPAARSRTSPTSLRTRRCWETAGG